MAKEHIQKTWGIPVGTPELADLSPEELSAIRAKAEKEPAVVEVRKPNWKQIYEYRKKWGYSPYMGTGLDTGE